MIIGLEKWLRMIEEIAKILKLRFPNLTTEETVKLSTSIVAIVRLEIEK